MKKNITPFAYLSVILITFLSFWSYSHAIGSELSVCVKKSGLVYVIGSSFKRADCQKNDSLLTWNTIGQQGDKGDKGDPGEVGSRGDKGDPGMVATSSSLGLYDGFGQYLGVFVGFKRGTATSVYSVYNPTIKANLDFISMNIGQVDSVGHAQTFGVTPNQIILSVPSLPPTNIHYANHDCTGVVSIDGIYGVGDPDVTEPNSIVKIGSRYFKLPYNTGVRASQGHVAAYSYLDVDGNCVDQINVNLVDRVPFPLEVTLPFNVDQLLWPLQIR